VASRGASGLANRFSRWNVTITGLAVQAAAVSATACRRPVAAAHAKHKLGRFSVSFQGDGDMMFAPGAMWTAAATRFRYLSVLHNNKVHQEVMHVQRLSNRRTVLQISGPSSRHGPVGTGSKPGCQLCQLPNRLGWWPRLRSATLRTGPCSTRGRKSSRAASRRPVDVV